MQAKPNRWFVVLVVALTLLIGTASIIAIVVINSSQSSVATEPDLSGRATPAPTKGDAPVDRRGGILPPAEQTTDSNQYTVDLNAVTAQFDPPFTLTARFTDLQYEHKTNVDIWHATTEADCASAAVDVLTALQAEHWNLKETGYLDLFGNAWGCVAIKGTASNISVLTITLMPATNAMRLNIVKPHAPS